MPVAGGQRAENAVEKKKADAKIGVHAAGAIDAVMMNVVKAPGASKPSVDQGRASHPEIADVHGIVEKAEGEKRPNHKVP
jgi:hypothetical protein